VTIVREDSAKFETFDAGQGVEVTTANPFPFTT
jgi:hypothetical protein